MKRTNAETAALAWHSLQMIVVTFILVAPKRGPIDHVTLALATLIIPFAMGCWICGLLFTQTKRTLLFAALYWTCMALQIEGKVEFALSMGLSIYLTVWDEPKVTIDILAISEAALLFVAYCRRRLTNDSSDRDKSVSFCGIVIGRKGIMPWRLT